MKARSPFRIISISMISFTIMDKNNSKSIRKQDKIANTLVKRATGLKFRRADKVMKLRSLQGSFIKKSRQVKGNA